MINFFKKKIIVIIHWMDDFDRVKFFSFFLEIFMNFSLQTHSIDGFGDSSRLLHAFSLRSFERDGGVPEDLLLGRRTDPRSSEQHRQCLLESLNIPSKEIFFVKQVHGDRVFVLDDPEVSADQTEREEADAMITHLKDKPIAVLTADCVPVILYDPERQVAGVVHAGRKGSQMNLVAKTISILSRVYGSHPGNVRMALGPAIGGCCYEVDEPCIEPFRKNYPEWERFVTGRSPGRYMLDLLKANEADAVRAGVLKEHIHHSGECTSCNNDRWYSYRKEGTTGRTVSLAMLLPAT